MPNLGPDQSSLLILEKVTKLNFINYRRRYNFAVYAADPKDAWNRIFQLLFTRTVKARLSSEFKEGAPFALAEGMGVPALRISTRVFAQAEIGDRAIEPLYPSFFTGSGALQVLTEPRYSQLKQALTDALNERALRPPLVRALMQSDAWAAYDILFERRHFGTSNDRRFIEREEELLLLLARFIRKLALTPQEIEFLPNNYSAAVTAKYLPDLFSAQSGWMEIQLLPNRLHDDASNFRRASRVFIKPRGTHHDKTNFLESLKGNRDIAAKIDAVALAVEDLLIDSKGHQTKPQLLLDCNLLRKSGFSKIVSDTTLVPTRSLPSEWQGVSWISQKQGIESAIFASALLEYFPC
jgi:hypothetical protein